MWHNRTQLGSLGQRFRTSSQYLCESRHLWPAAGLWPAGSKCSSSRGNEHRPSADPSQPTCSDGRPLASSQAARSAEEADLVSLSHHLLPLTRPHTASQKFLFNHSHLRQFHTKWLLFYTWDHMFSGVRTSRSQLPHLLKWGGGNKTLGSCCEITTRQWMEITEHCTWHRVNTQ